MNTAINELRQAREFKVQEVERLKNRSGDDRKRLELREQNIALLEAAIAEIDAAIAALDQAEPKPKTEEELIWDALEAAWSVSCGKGMHADITAMLAAITERGFTIARVPDGAR